MKRATLVLLPALLTLGLSITAMAQIDGRLGTRLDEGFKILTGGKTDEAAAIFDEVALAAAAANDDVSLANARRGQGRVRGARGDAAGMQAAYSEALRLAGGAHDLKAIGQVHMDMGFAAWQRADIPQIEAQYTLAAGAFEKAGLRSEQARALRNITFSNIPRPEKIAILERALTIAREGPDHSIDGLIHHQLGDLLWANNDQQGALDNYEAALPLLQGSELARLLTSFGRLNRVHGDAERALPYYQRALELLQSTTDRDGIRQAEDAVSISLSMLGRHREALAHAERALAIAEASRPSLVPVERLRVGEMALRAGDIDRALTLFAPDRGNTNLLTSSLTGRAEALLARGHLDAALTDANAAVAASATRDWEEKIRALDARGKTHERLGHLPDATIDAVAAVRVLEEVRGGLALSDDFRAAFSDGYRSFYDRAVRLLAESNQPQQAFEIAERGRARALLDLRAMRTVAPSATASPDHAAPDVVAHAGPDETVLAYWVTRNATYAWVLNATGVAYSTRLAIPRTELERMVATANSSPPNPAPTTTVARRGSPQTVFENDPRPTLKLLHERIFRPLRQALPARRGARLLIVADGPLLGLSFAELLASNGRYIVEDYTLKYAPSMALSRRTTTVAPADAKDTATLLVSLSTGFPKTNGETLAPLPGARREVDALARLFPGSNTTRMNDGDATEERVRLAMGRQGVIHLATHAVASSRQPAESFLALRAGGGYDGRLTAGEIIGMSLRAELVVLSACHGASGQVAGEGMMGLSRALLAAGAHTLLASVRELPDDAAAEMLPRFYAGWKASGDAAAALRSAQLEQLQRLRAGRVQIQTPFGRVTVPEHPSMWAGLVLIGEQ